ncbi:MAG: sodium:solute symporter family transporter [Planctomycetota bacterium]
MFDIDLPAIDLLMIVLYLVVVVCIGFWYRKRSARSMESYFQGNKSLPWWMLGLSGSVTNFDITGTMWLVSLIFLFGLKAFWIFWLWAFLIGAFLMSYMAKWIRRTNVMTAVELMRVRFGIGPGGRTARTAAGVMQVVLLLAMVGYAFQGVGKFFAAYLPFSPLQCACAIMGITALYVMAGGFRSVVATDVLQAVILNTGCIIVAILAFIHVDVEVLHQNVDLSLLPAWRIPEVEGTEHAGYELFGIMCLVWVATGLLISLGGAGGHYAEQRFLSTRDEREAALAGAGWGIFLIFRWALVAGICFLAVCALSGTEDPEQVLPTILRDFMPPGLRGFVLAGLVAAFMSTFSSTLNAGASILVRDLIQPFAPNLREKALIRISYLVTAGFVVFGVLIGTQARSINQIWIWLTIGLNASIILPNVLRWYWWRMNGWGYAAGIFSGMLVSLIVLFMPETPAYVYGPVIHVIALLGCISGSLLTRPVEDEILINFYRQVKPKGFWKPVRAKSGMDEQELSQGIEKTGRIVINVILGTAALFSASVLPFYLIGHWFLEGGLCLAVLLAAVIALYFTWYRPLSRQDKP